MLSIGTTALGGSAASKIFNTYTTGSLGAAAGSDLALASIGFNSGNNSSLGIHAYRITAGSGWTTASIGIGMDVDNTTRSNNPSFLPLNSGIWIGPNGGVGIDVASPVTMLDIIGPNGSASNTENVSTNTFQMETGKSSGDQILYIGNDKTNHNSYIQSVEYGITVEPLLLNARGGSVGIATANPQDGLTISALGPGAGGGQLRMVWGNYGALWRNDGADTYLLLTASGNPYGTWSNARPIVVDDASGEIALGYADNTSVNANGNISAGSTCSLEGALGYAVANGRDSILRTPHRGIIA